MSRRHKTKRSFSGISLEDVLAMIAVPDFTPWQLSAYLLLCVAEAKRDDFEQGRTQCVAEMIACRDSNTRRNHTTDVYGIVSNGQGWQFYKLTLANEVWETDLYVTSDLPRLLGALDTICGECAKLVPPL